MQCLVQFCVLLLLGASLPSCATALPQERRDYILAHPHGWVELSVKDRSIPKVMVEKDGKELLDKPSDCYVRIEINEEPYFGANVYPYGEEEPYVVDSGFRFPVPVGNVELYVSYSGCDVEDGEQATRETGIVVSIEEGMVIDVAFDGESMVPGVASPDTKVTLEDIYEAITGRRSVE